MDSGGSCDKKLEKEDTSVKDTSVNCEAESVSKEDEDVLNNLKAYDHKNTSGELSAGKRGLDPDAAATNRDAHDEIKDGEEDVECGDETEASDGDYEDNNEVALTEQVPDLQLNQLQQQQQPQQRAGAGILGMIKALLIRMVIIYILSSLMRRDKPPVVTQSDHAAEPLTLNSDSAVSNLFPKDMLMDMYVYVTENRNILESTSNDSLFWLEKDLIYGDWKGGTNGDGTFQKNGAVAISEAVRMNGSLFVHVYFTQAGQLPNFTSNGATNSVYGSQCLTKSLIQYTKSEAERRESNASAVHPLPDDGVKLTPYWNPKMTIGIIADHSRWVPGSVPARLSRHIRYVPDQPLYYPLVYFNTYWNLERDYVPINSTTETVNLTLTFSPLSLFQWRIYPVQSMSSLECPVFEKNPKSDESEDLFKMAFLANGLYPVIAVSFYPFAHAILSFLSCRNDIAFWSGLGSLEGVSACSTFLELYYLIVLTLHVQDVDTVFIFSLTAMMGLAVSAWKMTRFLDIRFRNEDRIFRIFPRGVVISEKLSYTNSQTKIYDMVAFKHVSYVLCLFVPGYIGYASINFELKNIYSWTLATLHGFLVTFGVFLAVPQIFINYKLKSVAHLSWRALGYKAMDSFLDSGFAFVLQAPSYYRVGFFRYDILFYIYLCQFWIYRQPHATQ